MQRKYKFQDRELLEFFEKKDKIYGFSDVDFGELLRMNVRPVFVDMDWN